MDDRELNQLLREWDAPGAPPGLRPPRRPRSPLRWLVSGTIPVPVPAALAAVLLAVVWQAGVWTAMPPGEPAPAPQTSRRSGEIARYPLTGPLEGFDAVFLELNFIPGRPNADHRHPGPILGYVVDGQVRTAVNNERDQIVPAGGTFFEPLGALHTTFGSASPDASARAVAILLVPTGTQRLVTPAAAN